jgi:hypothetical protein
MTEGPRPPPYKILAVGRNYGKASHQALEIAREMFRIAEHLPLLNITIEIYPSEKIITLQKKVVELENQIARLKEDMQEIQELGLD